MPRSLEAYLRGSVNIMTAPKKLFVAHNALHHSLSVATRCTEHTDRMLVLLEELWNVITTVPQKAEWPAVPCVAHDALQYSMAVAT